MTTTETLSERQFFGGAISCEIPSSWRDVSDVRQVPDHQECWQEIGDDGALLVVELLDRQTVSDADAAGFFFQDLAEANGIVESPSSSTMPTSSCQFQVQPLVTNANLTVKPGVSEATPCSGIGIQKIAMGRETDVAGNRREQEIKLTRVELCVLRLNEVGTDILVTLSKPIQQSSLNEPIEVVCAKTTKTFSDTFCRCIASFEIKDWGLFGG